ncbi:MAG: retropepsin-like aspartic protease family protein [Caulobacteraceae bacterium]
MSEGHGPWGPERPLGPPPRRFRLHLHVGALLWLGLLALAGLGVVALATLVPGQTEGGQGSFEILRLVGLAALVSSGLLTARRLDLGKAARAAALWAAILFVLVAGYVYRDDARDLALRMRSALFPAFAVAGAPGSVTVGRSEGGAFYVMGQVNGAPVRFAIDTGASDVVLSPADAARAHLDTDGLAFSQPSETANGVGYGAKTTAGTLAVGPIKLANVTVFVNQAPMSVSLLGMSFLSRLQSFEIRGDELIMRGKPGCLDSQARSCES